jgi:hypothetical protein
VAPGEGKCARKTEEHGEHRDLIRRNTQAYEKGRDWLRVFDEFRPQGGYIHRIIYQPVKSLTFALRGEAATLHPEYRIQAKITRFINPSGR